MEDVGQSLVSISDEAQQAANSIIIDIIDNQLVTIPDTHVVFQTVVSPNTTKLEQPEPKSQPTCKICGKTFSKMKGYNKHMRRIHKTYARNMEKPTEIDLTCYICDKTFSTRGNLNNHVLKVHNPDGNTPIYKCNYCSYQSLVKGTFKTHVLRNHLLPKPEKKVIENTEFPCKTCGKVFKTKMSLNAHVNNVHFPRIIYECDKCDFKTNIKGSYKKHLVRKHIVAKPDQPFKCSMCNSSFKIKAYMRRHEHRVHKIQHTSEVHKKKCPLCPFTSRQLFRDEILRHFREAHNIPLTTEKHVFNDLESFNTWKKGVEEQTNSYYKGETSATRSKWHNCNRSGNYDKSKTSQDVDGVVTTIKLNAFCPAAIHVKALSTGQLEAEYWPVHVGHRTCDEKTKTFIKSTSIEVFKVKSKPVNLNNNPPGINSKLVGDNLVILTLENVDVPEEKVIETPTEKNNTYETLVEEAVNSDDEIVEVTFKCGYCSYRCTNKHRCFRHIRQHAAENNTCKYCDQTFLHRAVLMKHIEAEHFAKDYKCGHCDFKTRHKSNFRTHLRQHESFRHTYTCEHCDRIFGHKRTLGHHIDVSHMNKDEFLCELCSYKTTREYNLVLHCSLQHNTEIPAIYRNWECSQCSAVFKRRGLLYAHERLKHNVVRSHVQRDLPYKCAQCDAAFTRKDTGYAHETRVHKNVKIGYYKKCPQCTFVSTKCSRLAMHTHFKEAHSIALASDITLLFNDLTSFCEWKEDLQKATGATYNGRQGMLSKYFMCLKNKQIEVVDEDRKDGNLKTFEFCPSEILLQPSKSGQFLVKYWPVHVGHEIHTQQEINSSSSLILNVNAYSGTQRHINEKFAKYLNETASDKNDETEILDDVSVAEKTSDKNVTDNTSGSKSITGKTSTTNNVEIVNESRPTSINIETRTEESSNPNDKIEMTNETVSDKNSSSSQKPVEEMFDLSWIENLDSNSETSMLQVKLTNVLSDDFPTLQKDDYVFIYMSNAQKDRITDIENKTIFIDKAYDIKVDLHVFSLLVIDESKNGYPVAFMFTNRRDEGVLRVLFMKIEEHLGRLTPGVFMSDIEDTVYSTWCTVMGPAKSHVYSTLHVLRAWKKNLDKIPSKDTREHVFSVLKSLLCEVDEGAFHELLDEIVNSSMFENEAYFKYLFDHFLVSMRYKQWAHCFVSNPKFSLESYGRVLKQCYLIGMGTENLSEVLRLILETFTNKLQDWSNESVMETDGKVLTIKNRHKNSLVVSRTNVRQASDCTWVVMSSAATRREFSVVRKVTSCSACDLVCSKCDSCVHEYVCSCWDGAMRDNMCVHIHLVVRSSFKSVENQEGRDESEMELVEEEDDDTEGEEKEDEEEEIVIHCGDLVNSHNEDSSGDEYFPDESSTDNDSENNEEAPVEDKLRRLKNVPSRKTESKNVNNVNDKVLDNEEISDVDKDMLGEPPAIRNKRSRSEDTKSTEKINDEILIELDDSPQSNSKNKNKRRKVISSNDEDGNTIEDNSGSGVIPVEVLIDYPGSGVIPVEVMIEVDEEQSPKFYDEVKSTSKDVVDTNVNYEEVGNVVLYDEVPFKVDRTKSQVQLKVSKVRSRKCTPEDVIDVDCGEVNNEVNRKSQLPLKIVNLKSIQRTPEKLSETVDEIADNGVIPDEVTFNIAKSKSQVSLPLKIIKVESLSEECEDFNNEVAFTVDRTKSEPSLKIIKVKSKKRTPETNVSSTEVEESNKEKVAANDEIDDENELETPPKFEENVKEFVDFCQTKARSKEQMEYIKKMMEKVMSTADTML